MAILAEDFVYVVGVDTHAQTHTAAVVDRTGAVLAEFSDTTDPAGLERLVEAARRAASGARLWAVEQTGSYGAGLTALLGALGETVVEIDRPARPARRRGKDDGLDALRAAREALSRAHLASPRARGAREALRVLLATRRASVAARTAAICQLKALVVTAPSALRRSLRGLPRAELVRTCSRLHLMQRHDEERRAAVLALRATARRIEHLAEEAAHLEAELTRLVRGLCPQLLGLPGLGVITSAQLLVSWSHPGRIRSEAAFAALAGVAPLPASSGQVSRHRLSRQGDRQLNRALHNIVLVRLRHDRATRSYAARRAAEGRSLREIQRCLKRAVARQLFRFLERNARMALDAP
ncbi:MAG TPA: IS110 family transposase [Miltoncostaeaceae bacterium]|jgi:transposase|nr:IS110 family transposase [Miltoncostaeaceae bacterium]